MTKSEAIDAMRKGEIVSHKHFTPEEWMKQTGLLYEFEDGCVCDRLEFWDYRTDDSWLTGWSIVELKETK